MWRLHVLTSRVEPRNCLARLCSRQYWLAGVRLPLTFKLSSTRVGNMKFKLGSVRLVMDEFNKLELELIFKPT